MIKKIVVKNFKIFRELELSLNSELNIIVGDNEAGKSTLLEAINLALTKKLNGRFIENEITPSLFSKAAETDYLDSVKTGNPVRLPSILIELYFEDNCELDESFRGSMNSCKENCIGVKLEIVFDDAYQEDYENLIKDENGVIESIPTEFYKADWHTFANAQVHFRNLPARTSFIDASTIRLKSGTDQYLQSLMRERLDERDRAKLSIEYRKIRDTFSKSELIKKLQGEKGAYSEKDLSFAVDSGSGSEWIRSLTPHLDSLPFHSIGSGEQTQLKIRLALGKGAESSDIILIEEPENHLSYSSMNMLLTRIAEKCSGKQIIVATHSAFVLNKLGLKSLIMMGGKDKNATLRDLSDETQKYFKKLPGYDTLRIVLAKRSILVEGPSDELVVQKAYLQKNGRLPINDGVDVINVKGLSFKRFLEIAKLLGRPVSVVTDNDSKYDEISGRFKEYEGCKNIRICISDNNDLPTMEPQIADVNDLDTLNKVLGKAYSKKEPLIEFMSDKRNKTECAMRLFDATPTLKFPKYIEDAIK